MAILGWLYPSDIATYNDRVANYYLEMSRTDFLNVAMNSSTDELILK